MKKVSVFVGLVIMLAGINVFGATMSNFNSQTTGLWDPDGSATYEDWNWKGHNQTGYGNLIISDTVYHGSDGKSMGQSRPSGTTAPQPYWKMSMDDTNDTLVFWFYFDRLKNTSDNKIAGADWVIKKNGIAGDSVSYIRMQPTDGWGDVYFEDHTVIVPQNTLQAKKWYKLIWQLDFNTGQATATVTDGMTTWGPSTTGFVNSVGAGDKVNTVYSYCNGTGSADEGPSQYVDDFAVIPEPATIGLLTMGILGLLCRKK